MSQAKTFVALDVHVSKTVAAIIDRDSGELRRQRLSGRASEVTEFVAGLDGPVRATYEAGPTGFALARRLEAAGVDCLVCAPGLIPRGPSDRVKTDQRDAERLVRLLIAGELHRVAVPTIEAESLRDLVRAREDLRGDLMSARHRVAKLLLRHDVRFEGSERNWTQPHLKWLSTVRFEHPGTQAAFDDYRGAVDALIIRRGELERQIAEQLPSSPWAQTAQRLMCLRGIDTLTAAGLCAEIGDFERFRHPEQLMSYLGVVPSEHSSGTRRRQGSITKSGSQHARRLLVEAAWHYRQPPRISEPLRRRQAGADPAIVALSWKTQRRLYRVWTRMEQRGKRRTIIAVAAARELAGFCWAISTA
ncbi:MAG: IS110 family transposase [Actinobacteria bacterium]|nr:IS110 family transposase [Actinomycetota bacterium]